MATSKVLQQPKILEIIGSSIRIAHPTLTGFTASNLAAPIAVGGTTMTLYDNNGFKDDDWFIIGSPGDSETEECDVNGAVTRGQSVTVTNTLKFAHEFDAPVTKIFERGIKIYGAATDGGAGTLIASVDAITTPITDAVMIQWDKQYTEYTLISTDTAYAYYYVKFTDGTTDSAASVYVPATGVPTNKIAPIIKTALDLANAKMDNNKLTREMFVNWANDCQEAVQQFVYSDPRSGNFIQKDWSFEITRNTSLVVAEGEDSYDLSSLSLKYPNSDKSIFDVVIGTDKPLRKMAIKDWDIARRGVAKTLMNSTAAAGDTSITVDSTADFPTSGSLRIGAQVITYTGVGSTTFTGIPTAGSGAITSPIADNTPVWSGISFGNPTRYVIYNGRMYFDIPPSADRADETIKVRYYKTIASITSVSDGTEIPFTGVFQQYFTSMIYYRLGQPDLAGKWMKDFEDAVRSNAIADYVPQLDEYVYYDFSDDVYNDFSSTSVTYNA